MLTANNCSPLELVFRPGRTGEVHVLLCQKGTCPDGLLKSWREEFLPFYEVNLYSTKELMFQFDKNTSGVPNRFRVRFEGLGRDRTATLTAITMSADLPTVPIDQIIQPVDPRPSEEPVAPNWRLMMLDELDKFIECLNEDPEQQYCLRFAWKRMNEMAIERPQYFTLMVFTIFIAAHSRIRQEHESYHDHLFRAAAVVLERVAADLEFSPQDTSREQLREDGVWNALSAFVEKWLHVRFPKENVR